ncbi:MAG: class I SAM-dependent methyltransferase [Hyphomonas sp.]|nr:class I SAM-dependent methyltransferase [Hyphomonas sp.]
MKEKPSMLPNEMADDVRKVIEPIAEHFKGKRPTPEAVLWPNAKDLVNRFDAMVNSVNWRDYSPDRRLRILDIGCGPGFLLDYLQQRGLIEHVDYTGIDLNLEILESAQERWPQHKFECRDIRQTPYPEGAFELAVLCGVFTVKFTLSQAQMLRLMVETLKATWRSVTESIAFNVMSKHVDWEREDLFHLPCDEAIALIRSELGTRQISVLHDYGLYEYTCVVRKRARITSIEVPKSWT